MAFEKALEKVHILDELNGFQDSLFQLGNLPIDIKLYDYAVQFFNIVTKFQDKSLNISILGNDKNKNTIAEFLLHLKNTGRTPYGWVRAPENKPVTLNNLYLGNIAGLDMRPAADFKNMENTRSDYDEIQSIILTQVYDFIQSHRVPMIKLGRKILNQTKNPKNNLFFQILAWKQAQK